FLRVRTGSAVRCVGTTRSEVVVRSGLIVALAPNLPVTAARTIDAGDKLIFPGFIDAHTHMGIPIKDTTSADDFNSGSWAAAFGGVTTILDFTVQRPGQTPREALVERIALAEGQSHVDFGIPVTITDRPPGPL